jgi:hypothetical protein
MARSGAGTLDLCDGSSPFDLYAMWGDGTPQNFNDLLERPACSGKNALARGGGGSRLELGIAGREKNAFYPLFTTF